MNKLIPNPGSDAAIAVGCICPVLDNGHDNERLGRTGERVFILNSECPLHELKLEKAESRENKNV